ncbi:MAG: CoA transferase, partial [Betaproteobacteria bacterium]|nr:CoA transferase [Betaproteobacteria bacterium]
MTDTFLSNVVVVEIGDRHAVGACGSLLAELGATVVLIEPSGLAASKGTKWTYRPAVAAGKRSFAIDVASASDIALVRQAIARADAVVVSSDTAPAWAREVVRGAEASTIVCDVTAFGRSGPLANRNYSDAL